MKSSWDGAGAALVLSTCAARSHVPPRSSAARARARTGSVADGRVMPGEPAREAAAAARNVFRESCVLTHQSHSSGEAVAPRCELTPKCSAGCGV